MKAMERSRSFQGTKAFLEAFYLGGIGGSDVRALIGGAVIA